MTNEIEENDGEFLQRLGTDAKVWGEEFIRVVKEKNLDINEDLMRAWFANAIMAGYDLGRQKAREGAFDNQVGTDGA